MAIYEVDPGDFAHPKTNGGGYSSSGGVRSGVLLQEQEDSEHPERMEVLRMGIEEHLASGAGETDLFERLRDYILKESSTKSRLQTETSR